MIRSIANNDNPETFAKDFQNAIEKVCDQLSCKYPQGEMFLTLVEWHLKYFRDFTIAEVKLAFEMYIRKQITIEARNPKGEIYDKTPEHYGTFSSHFYTEVLMGYTDKRNKALAAAKEEIRTKQIEPPKKSDEEINIGYLKLILDEFTTPSIFGTVKYKKLIESGLLNLSKDEKKEYMIKGLEQIKIQYTGAIDSYEAKRMAGILKEIKSDPKHPLLIYEAQKLAYSDFLKNPENKKLVEEKLQPQPEAQ